ncbi:MAG: hypothetical protein JRN54_06590 [Nitrososphaerota archaeon]|nr:hypothetical protein [Nitrososphaerota archaeon]
MANYFLFAWDRVIYVTTVTFGGFRTGACLVEVAIFRDDRNRAKYRLYPETSSYGGGPPSESKIGDVEMPEGVYRALVERFSSRGYAVVPDDIADNELASEWWSVVSMLVR